MPPRRSRRAAAAEVESSTLGHADGEPAVVVISDDDKDGDVVMVSDCNSDDEDSSEETQVPKKSTHSGPGNIKVKDASAAKLKRGLAKRPPKEDSKSFRDLTSVKDKITRAYGYNSDKLFDVLNLRKEWATRMFQFDVEMLSDPSEQMPCQLPLVQSTTLTKPQLNFRFPLPQNSINFQLDDQTAKQLSLGESYKAFNIEIVNTATLITDLAWCPNRPEASQLLAVAVSNITDTAVDSRFAISSRNAYASGFYIYELDHETAQLKLRNIITHNWGNAWDLQWIPSSMGIGCLCAVFNDGDIRFLNLGPLQQQFIELEEASLTYHVDGHMLSTFDLLGDRVICGTSTGYVVEFILGELEPSYFFPRHTDYIYALRVGDTKFDEPMIFTTCMDCTSALSSLIDLKTSVAKLSKTKTVSPKAAYSPTVYSFIHTDNPQSSRIMSPRAFFVSHSLSKHDGSTECISTSDMHPMTLTGGADGKVLLCNSSRRAMNGPKAQVGSHRTLTLFQLQYGASEDTYRLVQTLEVEDVNNDNSVMENVYPSNVCVTSVKWNVNKKSGKWLAAGTTSGLLVLKKI